MREVKICLHFLQPCLSGLKNEEHVKDDKAPHYVFLRDSSGDKALLLQERWNRIMVFARKAMSRSIKPVYDVRFDPIIDGPIGIHHRFYDARNPNQYKRHEAFLEGTQITVRAVLPDGFSKADIRATLDMGGRYCGITEHGWGEYGRFEVISVD